MKIIISPAKNMKEDPGPPIFETEPVFIQRAAFLADHLKNLDYQSLKSLLNCGDSIARPNFERYQNIDLYKNQTAAILAFDGIQYKYMAPTVFENKHFSYIREHLRILSGLYGILRPLDGVVPYRLEMQSKLKTDFCKSLYDFWGADIYEELTKSSKTVINLASDEYSKCVYRHLSCGVRFINVIFGEKIGEKIVEKGVYVKMARGEMVRFMAENDISDPEDIKNFNNLGYNFSPSDSEKDKLVFLGKPKKRK